MTLPRPSGAVLSPAAEGSWQGICDAEVCWWPRSPAQPVAWGCSCPTAAPSLVPRKPRAGGHTTLSPSHHNVPVTPQRARHTTTYLSHHNVPITPRHTQPHPPRLLQEVVPGADQHLCRLNTKCPLDSKSRAISSWASAEPQNPLREVLHFWQRRDVLWLCNQVWLQLSPHWPPALRTPLAAGKDITHCSWVHWNIIFSS